MSGVSGPRLVFLGTGAARAAADRDNVSLLFQGPRQDLLIDCAGNVHRKLLQIGADPARLHAIVLTHAHVDHVYGLPYLLQSLRLGGRTEPLWLLGLPEVLDFAARLVDLFRPVGWDEGYPLHPRTVRPGPDERIEVGEDFVLGAAFGEHTVASIGVRCAVAGSAREVTYTGDTRPCPSIQRLAQGSDLLVCDATWPNEMADRARRSGHPTAGEAGAMARAAGVGRLLLVHFSPLDPRSAEWEIATIRRQAIETFGGPVDVPSDLDVYPLV